MNLNQFGAPRKEGDKGVFTLPGDIEQVVSVDAQNVLSVAGGSDEDFSRLQELVEILDQPLRRVEIEAQFVELNAEDLNSFGIDFPDGPDKEKVGFVRGNFDAKLNALIAAGRAKVFSAPRVTAINGMPATMDAATPPTNGTPPEWAYEFTPTLNGDDTITLSLKGKTEPVEGQENFNFIINARDGDTIAVLLKTTPQAANATSAARVRVVFITPRILRRASDVKRDSKN